MTLPESEREENTGKSSCNSSDKRRIVDRHGLTAGLPGIEYLIHKVCTEQQAMHFEIFVCIYVYIYVCVCVYIYMYTLEEGNTEHTFTFGTILKIVPDSFLGFLLFEIPFELWYFW